MRRAASLAFVGVLPLAVFAAGCGGDETTASKSAAAFDEAQRKGTAPTGGEAHGHHGEAESTKGGPAGGHRETPPAHSGHDPGASTTETVPRPARGGSSMAGMDHSAMTGAGRSGMTGIDHSRMTGRDRANVPGTDHSTMAHPAVGAAPPIPERPAAAASPGQMVGTLRPDGLDTPEPTAIRDAARSAEMAQQMAGGAHGMSHGTYRQIDAGRDEVAPAPSGHEPHQMTPAARPPSSAKPHGAHSAPAAAAPPQGASAPKADPHAHHARPAVPRPSPAPSPRPTPTPRPKADNR
jgi:hypothetical protein